MHSKLILANRFAKMWRKSRELAGLSQDHMAKSLGVSRKTVQNWENGTSSPSQVMGFEWFITCGLQPLPFYLEALFPELFENLSSDTSDKSVDDALRVVIKDLPDHHKRILLYLFTGNHGSSPTCVLQMIAAHLQSPLRDRLNIAESIRTNYEMAVSAGTVQHPENTQPNIQLLDAAISAARSSLKAGYSDYTTI